MVTNGGVLAGFSTLRKYFLNGSEDRTFRPVPPPSIWELVLRNGKRLVFYSNTPPEDSVVVRRSEDGTVDPEYEQPRFGVNARITAAMIERGNGQVYVAGTFSEVNGLSFPRLVRLNENGTLDDDFRADSRLVGSTNTPNILVMALQANGKLLVGGSFPTGEPAVSGNLVRLNANGTLDTSFNVGAGAKEGNDEAPGTQYHYPPKITRVAVQRDGKIVVGGDFRRFAGFARDGVARLHGDPVQPIEIESFRMVSLNRGVLDISGTADVVEVEAAANLTSTWHSVMVTTVTNEVSTTVEVPIDSSDGAKFLRIKRR